MAGRIAVVCVGLVLACLHAIAPCQCTITKLPGVCVDEIKPSVPALFLLGDSILDPGNNNRFVTLAKVNYYPYGIDFPGNVPSGRFSNGFNAADYLAFQFGLPLIPAFHNPATKGRRLLQGVNFASGGSGILSTTGKVYGEVDSLQEQVKRLKDVKEEVRQLMGEVETEELFASAAFIVVTGSNDWLLSFFNPVLPIRVADKTSSQHHRDNLIHTLISHIEAMYTLGARKIVVAGLPALGCCPSQVMEYNTKGVCVEHINNVSKDYNEHLLPQVLALNDKYPDASFSYIDIYTLILETAQDPSKLGFKTGNTACCGIGKYKGFLTCLEGLHPCDSVEDHFYWDAYHPSQSFYPYLVSQLWSNGPPHTHPRSLKETFNPNLNSRSEIDSHSEL